MIPEDNAVDRRTEVSGEPPEQSAPAASDPMPDLAASEPFPASDPSPSSTGLSPLAARAEAPAPEEPESSPEEVPDDAAGSSEADDELAEFDSLIGSYLDGITRHEIESIIVAPVVQVHSDHVLVDMGDKAEGIVDIHELIDRKGYVRVSPGDKLEVMVLGRDEETGLIQVSHRQALLSTAWERIVQAQKSGEPVSGVVSRTVKSGLLVDIGLECFMPASHISDERVNNLEEWVDRQVDVVVLDVDERKHRAVVSRRKLVEEHKRKVLEEALDRLTEGHTVTGEVRNVRNFGAFIKLDGVDAFLPREEISWDRAANPTAVLTTGQRLKVQIVSIDRETGRVRVSRKALKPDPWESVQKRYPEGTQVRGDIVTVTRFGAFVHIEEGLTGLIHVSELSWSKGPTKVTDHVKEGDSVRAIVLNVDLQNRRLSLGLKQLVEDPWVEAEKQFPRGSRVKGEVTGLANFGAFVKLTDEIEGLIHVSDFSWDTHIKHPGEVVQVGQEVEAVVLKTDRQSRRISLSIKQMTESPFDLFIRKHPAGSTIEGPVVRMIPTGAFVSLAPNIDGFLHVSQIATDRIDKPDDVLKKDEVVRCRISKIDRKGQKVSLSRKALIEKEEAEAIREFSADPDSKGVMKLGELLQGIEIQSKDD